MNESAGLRVYQALPLTGSAIGRLRDDTTKMLASGELPRCPHPDQPAFFYAAANRLTCAACAGDLVRDADVASAACHVCGDPAAAVLAWVAGGVACVAALCEQCHTSGLVPLAVN